MKDFILANWLQLLYVIVSVVSIVILLVKKNKVKVIDNNFLDVALCLPLWISEAEQLYPSGHGSDKFSYVFNSALQNLVVSTGLSSKDVIAKYGTLLQKSIEDILSTPIKKGEVR